MDNKTRLRTLAVIAAGVAAAASTQLGEAQAKEGHEKCYGVVKAGQNDCGAADKSHDCHAKATEDASPNEWLYVPTGMCAKLVNGSTTPPAADAAE